jgi:hypothetical protein
LVTPRSTGLKSSQIVGGHDSNVGGSSPTPELRTLLYRWIRAIVY